MAGSAYPSEATVVLTKYQQWGAVDANDMATIPQATTDNIVAAFLAAGQGYTGLGVTANADALGVTVGTGILYNLGGGYPLRSAEPIDLTPQINAIPDTLSSQIVLIVANGGTAQVTESRTLEDASLKPTNPADLWPTTQQVITTRAVRVLTPSIVPGVVSASNVQAPAYNPLLCLLATVVINKTGVVSVAQNTAARITRLDQLAPIVAAQGNQLAGYQTAISGLLSSVSTLATALAAQGASFAAQIAALQNAITTLENRQATTSTGSVLTIIDTYTDTTGLTVQPNNPGYGIGGGLTFPKGSQNPTSYNPQNAYAANLKLWGGRYLTPAVQITGTGDATLNDIVATKWVALNSAGIWSDPLKLEGFGVARTRYGAAYAAQSAAAVLATGDPTALFAVNPGDLTYDPSWRPWTYYNPEIDHRAGYWHDLSSRGRWAPRVADGTAGGWFAVSKVYKTQTDDMITSYQLPMRVGTTGDVRLIICEDAAGAPDPSNVLMDLTVPYANLKNSGVPGGVYGNTDGALFNLPYPLLRKAGKLYHFVVLTSGDHSFRYDQHGQGGDPNAIADLTRTTTGWQTNTDGYKLASYLLVASFGAADHVELGLLYLGGGIDAIDLLVPAIVPQGCDLTYSTIPSGQTYFVDFDPASSTPGSSGNLLAGRPAQMRLFVSLKNTGATAPVIDLQASSSGAANTVPSRQAGTLSAQSPVRTPAQPVKTITRQVSIAGFIVGTHTYSERLDTGSGFASGTPATTTTGPTAQADGTVLFTFSWTLASAVPSFQLDYSGTTSDTSKVFTIPKAITTASP